MKQQTPRHKIATTRIPFSTQFLPLAMEFIDKGAHGFGYNDRETGGRLLIEAPNRKGILGNLVRRQETETGKQSSVLWDEVTERLITHLTVTGPDGEYQVKSGVLMYSLTQYRLLMQLAGLRLEHVYGEELSPFEETSRRMIMVAVKPKS